MAFSEYRNRRKNSETREFDFERFAYDVFAYMLPICGFPEEKIPPTPRNENIYINNNVIRNVGLSVLPIALYMRDQWKTSFELKLATTGFHNILEIGDFLKSELLNCPNYEEDDILSKIQFSLAIYNEMILFFNYKGLETYIDILPKSWSQFCVELIAQTDDIDEPLYVLMRMDPYITETWIINFLSTEAIPYGSSEDVSDRFSEYSFAEKVTDVKSIDQGSDDSNKIEEEVTDVKSVDQGSDDSNKISEKSLPEDSDSGSYYLPGGWDFRACAGKFQVSEGRDFVEQPAYSSHSNGLTYVLHHSLKGRKRTRTRKLGVEDAFREISLLKENVSPENRDTKRQCRISDKDERE